MDFNDIVQRTIDLHVHVGPEIIPRKYTVPELITQQTGKIARAGVKNHFFSTAPFNPTNDPFIIPSVVLNHYVGGLNPAAVRATIDLAQRPIIVWFPTIHSVPFLASQELEIPNEWIDPDMQIKNRPAADITPITVLDVAGNIRPDVIDILQIIADSDSILATGHLSWQESQQLVTYAMTQIGVKNVIITHPIYQKINMPIVVQQELAALGAYMEHAYSMHVIDDIPMIAIVEQIQAVGAKHCILTSDMGQNFTPPPHEALNTFMQLLAKEGITREDIETMAITNPGNLVGH